MSSKGFGTNFHHVYSSNAELYDLFSNAEYFSGETLNALDELSRDKQSLLDIGSGTGHKTNLLSKKFSEVIAVEPSDKLRLYAAEKYPKIKFLKGCAENLPLDPDCVDVIISTWASLIIPRAIDEMLRVSKKGGVIIRIGAWGRDEFTELFPNLNESKIIAAKRIFRDYGFIEKRHKVVIKFNSLDSSKQILSAILNVDENKIKKSSYVHEITFNYLIND